MAGHKDKGVARSTNANIISRWIEQLRKTRFSIRTLLLALSSIALMLIVDMWMSDTLPVGTEHTCASHEDRFNLQSKLQDHFARVASHEPVNRKVTLVTISGASEPLNVLTNTCDSRLFIADLVKQLKTDGARAIVIDKYYSKGACTKETEVNEPFRKALADANIPIVVGQQTQTKEDSDDDQACLVLTPPFDFTPKSAGTRKSNVTSGLIRLNSDTRRIPLRFQVFKSEEDQTADAFEPSLALAAAEAVDPGLARDHQLAPLIRDQDSPYSVLTPPDGNPAMGYICQPVIATSQNGAHPTSAWGDCTRFLGPKRNQLQSVRGRVVIIGDLVSSDQKPYLTEHKYGVELHAMYIEALLSERGYLKPFSTTFQVIALICLLLALHLASALQPTWQGRLRISATIFVFVLVAFSVTPFLGYYPPLDYLLAVVLNPFTFAICYLGEDAMKKKPEVFSTRKH